MFLQNNSNHSIYDNEVIDIDRIRLYILIDVICIKLYNDYLKNPDIKNYFHKIDPIINLKDLIIETIKRDNRLYDFIKEYLNLKTLPEINEQNKIADFL